VPVLGADALEQFLRRLEGRETLRQIDRTAIGGELAHHREYRRADVRQLAVEGDAHRRATMALRGRHCQRNAELITSICAARAGK
jgi:hypothetical protein